METPHWLHCPALGPHLAPSPIFRVGLRTLWHGSHSQGSLWREQKATTISNGGWVVGLSLPQESVSSLQRLKQSLFLRDALCFEAVYQKGSTSSCYFFFYCKKQWHHAYDKASSFHSVPACALDVLHSPRAMHTNTLSRLLRSPCLITQHSCLFCRQLSPCDPSKFAWLTKSRNKQKSEPSKSRKSLLF